MTILPGLAPYFPTFTGLALLALITLTQSFHCAPLAFVKNDQTPGLPLNHDHSALSFRVIRTYPNSAGNLPAFAVAAGVAVAAGAAAELVNALAWMHLATRLAFWGIYYAGIGKATGGPRTLAYVGGLLTNMVLAGVAVWTLL